MIVYHGPASDGPGCGYDFVWMTNHDAGNWCETVMVRAVERAREVVMVRAVERIADAAVC